MQEGVLKKYIFDGTKWLAITELLSKLIAPITNIILARILVPEAFGIVTTITMIISFVDMFTDAGFQKYIIQHEFTSKREKFDCINVAFWTNLIISFVLWGGIIFFSDNIANVIGIPGLGIVISISCIQLPISSFSSIQLAIYKRNFDFKTLFLVRMIGCLIPFLITLPLALLGGGYWALIIGNTAIALVNAIFLTIKSEWKPEFSYDIELLRQMFAFSGWSLIETVSIWFSSWIDTFMISGSLNPYYLGIYRTSINTVNSVISIITGISTPILFSTLSRLQMDKNRFNDFFYNIQKLTAYLLFPIGFGMYVYSDLITNILLGSQWSEASEIIGIWGLVNSIKTIFGDYCSEYYRAQGKPKISLVVQLSFILLFIPMCIIGAKRGFIAVIYVGTVGRLAIVIIHNIIMRIVFNMKLLDTLKNVIIPLFCSIIMAVIGSIFTNLISNIGLQICSIIILGIIYLALLLLFAKEDVIKIYRIFKYKTFID